MAFPTQTIMDSCVRADENPISLGGLWVDGGFGAFVKLVSNQAQATSAGSAVTGWANIATSADVEFYLSTPTVPAAGETVYLLYRCSSPSAFGPNGYVVAFDGSTGHLSNARLDAGAWAGLSYDFIPGFPAVDGIGVGVVGSTHTPYYFTGGSWTAIAVNTDGTYTSPGYFSLFLQGGTGGRYTNIGLGPASSVPPGGGSGVFSGSAVPSSHSLDRGMYKAVARGIAR